MHRLRLLSESECYARCYGERNESVTLIEVQPHSLSIRELGDPLLLETPLPERTSEPTPAGWQPFALLAEPD